MAGSALLEADFTTERAQHDFRCGPAGSTNEGTSRLRRKPGMPGLERKVVLHPAQHRVRSETGRDIRGRQGLDIAGVGGEPIVAAGTEITIVKNLPAAGIHLHQRPINRRQMDVAADGSDFNVAVANIGQRD